MRPKSTGSSLARIGIFVLCIGGVPPVLAESGNAFIDSLVSELMNAMPPPAGVEMNCGSSGALTADGASTSKTGNHAFQGSADQCTRWATAGTNLQQECSAQMTAKLGAEATTSCNLSLDAQAGTFACSATDAARCVDPAKCTRKVGNEVCAVTQQPQVTVTAQQYNPPRGRGACSLSCKVTVNQPAKAHGSRTVSCAPCERR